jgi:hypothetical protein
LEADGQHVAVAHLVRLSLEPLKPASRNLRIASRVDQVVPAHDLAADEPSRNVGVDRLRRLESRLTTMKRPPPRLLLAGGEERHEAQDLEQPSDDLVERRLAVPIGGGLLLRQLAQLGLELQVDAAGAVDDCDHRLGRQRLELRRQLAFPLPNRMAPLHVSQQPLELRHLVTKLRIAGFRLLRDPLEPSLDVVAVRHEQLELQPLQVALRIRARRESVHHGDQCIDPAQVAEQLRPGPRHVDDACRRGSHLRRRHNLRDLPQPLVRDRRHPDVLLAEVRPDPRPRQDVEQGRLARGRQAHDSRL